MRLKGDQSTTRALNRRLVLDELRRNGPMSRAVLADSVGLSPAAVTFVTADLLGEGLIAEGTAVAGAPGRRPIPLRIDYDSRFSAGVKIETHGVEGVVTNLATEIIAQASAPLEDFRPEAVVGAVASVVEGLFEEAGVDRGSVIGIGLAFSGEIDGETGTCRQIQRFGWQNVPFAAMLADHLLLPTWIDNNANALAVSQHLYGHGQGKANVAVILIGNGVGAGFILDNRLYRGASGAAGEFGHNLEERGRTCACGRNGCLEAFTATYGMLQSWIERDSTIENPTVEGLQQAVEAGDPTVRAIIRDAGYRLGRHIANLVNAVNPDIVVFSGEGMDFGDVLLDPIREVMGEFCFPGMPDMVIATEGTDWSRGAAALAIQHFFDFESSGGAFAAEPDNPPAHGVRHYEPA